MFLNDTAAGEGNHEQRCLIGWLPEIKPKAGSWQLPPGRRVLAPGTRGESNIPLSR